MHSVQRDRVVSSSRPRLLRIAQIMSCQHLIHPATHYGVSLAGQHRLSATWQFEEADDKSVGEGYLRASVEGPHE